jgi:hypothetical protein
MFLACGYYKYCNKKTKQQHSNVLEFLREQKEKLQLEEDKKEKEMQKYTLKAIKVTQRSLTIKNKKKMLLDSAP